MTGPASNSRGNPTRGFTLLEILIAMAIFTVLGTMVVYFMRQSLNIFYAGTRESAALDRMDTVLPQVAADLRALTVPDDVDPPPPQLTPDEIERRGRERPPPPPPVSVRLRAGWIRLSDVEDPIYKEYPCPYFAFVVSDAGEWADQLKRRAGEQPTADGEHKSMTPKTVREGDREASYLPTGGMTEVCWIAIPQDLANPPANAKAPRYPAILTLYRGYRAPIGDPAKSLLNPANLSTVAKIKAACGVKAEGLLHFSAVWRRVFAHSWDIGPGIGVGETAPYVGPLWDSTRALDRTWQLHRNKESLSDPSDDIFPAFVRLETTLAGMTQSGSGRGEMSLVEAITTDDTKIRVSNPDLLLGPHLGRVRYIKVDREWMQYGVKDVDYAAGEVRVRRGRRGTKKLAHPAQSWCYIGTPATLEVRLPVFRDGYVRDKK